MLLLISRSYFSAQQKNKKKEAKNKLIGLAVPALLEGTVASLSLMVTQINVPTPVALTFYLETAIATTTKTP